MPALTGSVTTGTLRFSLTRMSYLPARHQTGHVAGFTNMKEEHVASRMIASCTQVNWRVSAGGVRLQAPAHPTTPHPSSFCSRHTAQQYITTSVWHSHSALMMQIAQESCHLCCVTKDSFLAHQGQLLHVDNIGMRKSHTLQGTVGVGGNPSLPFRCSPPSCWPLILPPELEVAPVVTEPCAAGVEPADCQIGGCFGVGVVIAVCNESTSACATHVCGLQSVQHIYMGATYANTQLGMQLGTAYTTWGSEATSLSVPCTTPIKICALNSSNHHPDANSTQNSNAVQGPAVLVLRSTGAPRCCQPVIDTKTVNGVTAWCPLPPSRMVAASALGPCAACRRALPPAGDVCHPCCQPAIKRTKTQGTYTYCKELSSAYNRRRLSRTAFLQGLPLLEPTLRMTDDRPSAPSCGLDSQRSPLPGSSAGTPFSHWQIQ
jgi:hypothetical protein